MRYATIILFCLATALTRANAAPLRIRVTPFAQVYPSLELSQVRQAGTDASERHVIGSGNGLVAVQLRARHAGEAVDLAVELADLAQPARIQATLPLGGVDYTFQPVLHFDRRRLAELREPRQAMLRVQVRRDGATTVAQEQAVRVHPLDEALYFVRDGRDSVDLSWIFAAYVDEDDPVVAQVLSEARAAGIATDFAAATDRDGDAVLRQVWAIWDVLTRRGIRYSGADPALQRGPHGYSQRVRSLVRTWADRSANCIDGSVLIASVLQRIGIHSFLVLVPGHAFIGFYTDASAHRAAYLESTLLGARVAAPARIPRFADDAPSGHESSLASFAAALAAGNAHHARVARKLDGHHRPQYGVIDVPAARAFGIRPIGAP